MGVQTTRGDHSCPVCGAAHDALTGTGKPQPGVLILCVACFCWLVMEDDGQMRKMTDGEWSGLPHIEQIRLTFMRDGVMDYQKRRRNG
jgi:hypothetical protein